MDRRLSSDDLQRKLILLVIFYLSFLSALPPKCRVPALETGCAHKVPWGQQRPESKPQLAGLECIAGSPHPLLQNPNTTSRQIIKSDAVWKGSCFVGGFFTVWTPGKPLHWYHPGKYEDASSMSFLYFPHWSLSMLASASRIMIHWQWYLHDIYNALYTQQLIHDHCLWSSLSLWTSLGSTYKYHS